MCNSILRIHAEKRKPGQKNNACVAEKKEILIGRCLGRLLPNCDCVYSEI